MASLRCLVVVVAAGSSIRLKGRNLTECEHIKLGAYHTLELEPQRAFSLAKACWDSLDIERLRSACDPQASADLAALLITVRPAVAAAACTTTCMPAEAAGQCAFDMWIAAVYRRREEAHACVSARGMPQLGMQAGAL